MTTSQNVVQMHQAACKCVIQDGKVQLEFAGMTSNNRFIRVWKRCNKASNRRDESSCFLLPDMRLQSYSKSYFMCLYSSAHFACSRMPFLLSKHGSINLALCKT